MSAARRIAFVCPRFAEHGTVGGAETLLRQMAERAAAAGRQVVFLTTCATDHFSWANAVPPGARRLTDNFEVRFFPVDPRRDISAFLRAQNLIDRGAAYSTDDEQVWLRNSVNSSALYSYLREEGREYDRIVMGPYLFGLTYFAARLHPDRTMLVPCLHDENFARVRAFGEMFRSVRGIIFNSAPERDLARRLYGVPAERTWVVGMGLDPFDADPERFRRRHGLTMPYLLYAGRREAGKGVPLLLDYLDLYRKLNQGDLRLVLLGGGSVPLPPDLAPAVVDAGFVSEEDKQSAMAGAAVFCQPSTNESFSIVLLEAWLAGAPALVHAACAVTTHHCRRSGGGLWFMTYAEFEAELRLLLEHADLRRRLGAAGRAYVQREYRWPVILARFLEALDHSGE
ncbi:MAG: glycosyltransferase family 4 protein [Kiritimatiellia bacterium]|nr:glycosyltransferase family 4 protein [Lentisphaerota bacterium]